MTFQILLVRSFFGGSGSESEENKNVEPEQQNQPQLLQQQIPAIYTPNAMHPSPNFQYYPQFAMQPYPYPVHGNFLAAGNYPGFVAAQPSLQPLSPSLSAPCVPSAQNPTDASRCAPNTEK